MVNKTSYAWKRKAQRRDAAAVAGLAVSIGCLWFVGYLVVLAAVVGVVALVVKAVFGL